MGFEWWHWIVLGIALVIAELVVPAFFVIWFGLGALLVGLVLTLLPALGMTVQLALWILASLAMVVLWFRVFKRSDHKTRIGQSDGDSIGEVGMMSKPAAPFERGRVRFQKPLLGSDEWECVVDEPVAAGERVRVMAVEGSFLRVEKANSLQERSQ
ncbi:MAG: NfeD family protein [Rhodocyclaceae bacterium]|nr:MAG: NfeD family protein [Rhodocyclaceae bacterium]